MRSDYPTRFLHHGLDKRRELVYNEGMEATTGQTLRYYNNCTKSYERETILAIGTDGYATVTDGNRNKRMPVAALATWEVV